MLQRAVFQVLTDTGGDFEATSGPVSGLIMQVAIDTGAFDTGCDFRLQSVQSGVVIADWDNAGGSVWARGTRIATFDTGGTEVGNQYPLLHDEQLRLTVTQSEGVPGSKSARLYVWTGW